MVDEAALAVTLTDGTIAARARLRGTLCATKPHLVRPSLLGFKHYYDTLSARRRRPTWRSTIAISPGSAESPSAARTSPGTTPEPWFSHYDPECRP